MPANARRSLNPPSGARGGSGASAPGGAGRNREERSAERAVGDLMRRVPPHSVEAEQAVLAGVFLNPSVMHTLADMLRPEDFYLPAHRTLFGAFLELYRKGTPIDAVTTAEYLKANEQMERAGGAVLLAELGEAVVVGANAEHYAATVRDRGLQRSLIAACADIIGNCYTAAQNVAELLDESERSIFNISRRVVSGAFRTTKDLNDRVFERLTRLAASRDVLTGVPTGFRRLDDLTSGLQRSDLIIIAARTSVGKTAFAMSLALNAALREDIPVCVYSLEMAAEQLMMRMLATRARVDATHLRRPGMLQQEEWEYLQTAAEELSRAPLFIDDSAALSTLELRARTRRLKAERNIGLVVVDYLQLMRPSRRTDSREQEIAEISRSLKALAKELDIPVIALSQLNREVEKRENKRPTVADLRESGAIEQDADLILLIYREDVHKYKNPAERPAIGDAEIIIGKHRNGPVGAVELAFHSRYTDFVEKEVRIRPSENQGSRGRADS